MVVDTRFELVTPAMSMQCSTTELIDQPILKDASSLFDDAKSSLNCNQYQAAITRSTSSTNSRR